ncbi:MAG TPA: efflux RND transporter periplasmic adaptor subunit [Gammaproteobacteria bacterium]|nr:efflux RND transporter periplasmic adaptor subunit [Gammaproteobacteria bacterium]
MTTRTTALLPALLAALCAACSKPPPPPPAPPTVEVATPLLQRVSGWDDYSGRFEAVDSVDVRPRVSGTIESVHFTDGQVVKQGDLLFVIDPRPYAAELAQAKAQVAGARAQLANADAELKRAQALVGKKLVSESEAEVRAAAQQKAAAELAAAEATVQMKDLSLSFTRVTAPLTGRASYRRLAPGNIVTADTTVLTTIVSQDPIRFLFDVPESALLKYKREAAGGRASRVEIRLQDEKDYRWKGRVDFLDNALDRGSGTIRLRAVVDNPDGFIAPGMFGQMRLYATEPFDALLVPDQAVVTDQVRQVVYTVDAEGTVGQKVVTVGQLLDGYRVIREGLAPQDRIVISGVQRARPGRRVTVKESTVSAFPSGVSRGEDSTLSLPAAASGTH